MPTVLKSGDNILKETSGPVQAFTGIKTVPLQAWSDPEGSRNLRFPDFMTTAQGGGKVVSFRHRPGVAQRVPGS